jgi:excisionase family DNA binding protein
MIEQIKPVEPWTAPAVEKTKSDEMLTKKELALRLKMTVRTVENWQRRGILPFVKVGKIVLFHWTDVVEHLKTHFRICRRNIIK